jgi:hypothetical protein
MFILMAPSEIEVSFERLKMAKKVIVFHGGGEFELGA